MGRKLRLVVVFMLAALAGCGGGVVGIDVVVGSGFDDDRNFFVVWSGNSNGDRVVDVNNHAFAFYSDNGCLYNFATGQENRSFCLTSTAGTALYGPLRIRIANIRSVTGTCIAALLEEVTGRFIDIELDAAGREVAVVTAMLPASCLP
jgi:hypothetical protein